MYSESLVSTIYIDVNTWDLQLFFAETKRSISQAFACTASTRNGLTWKEKRKRTYLILQLALGRGDGGM